MDSLIALFNDNVWMQVVAIVVTAASGILMLFPVPKEGTVLWWIRKGVEWLALNFFHSKNATTDK